MRVALVRHGDTTTTGGFVMAFKSGMHDHGKKIAISGDRATCGTCKGNYPIHGTGKGVSDRGVLSIVDGDGVLCPCGKNRVIASMNAGCHLERKTEAATGSAANSRSAAAPSVGMAFDPLCSYWSGFRRLPVFHRNGRRSHVLRSHRCRRSPASHRYRKRRRLHGALGG
jgi:uncharacterized Zn-binding protein involved in type VI secretion